LTAHARRTAKPAQQPTRPARTFRPAHRPAPIDRPDDQGGTANARRNDSPDPALLDFANWFADWWLRRGRDLTNPSSLPWGYIRDPTSKLAVRHTERAPLVLALFERYATGHESDRTLAAWLNAKDARTARNRPFGKDTVREMLCNVAYAGYVSGLRDKSRAIKGLHEPIVPEELFDRVQEVRGWRTRVVKPGPPSEEYLLRKLLYCERCGARMHGTRGSKTAVRRYMCSTRRYGHSCGERIVKAEQLEGQLVDWIRDFQPHGELLDVLLQTVQAVNYAGSQPTGERRSELLDQLQRLQDLYVLGDLTKPQYVMRRQALEEEVQRLGPPREPAVDRARAPLEDFPRFSELETRPPERRKLLLSLFGQIWAQDGRIVAVQPHDDFLPYFQAAQQSHEHHPDEGWCRKRERRGLRPRLLPRGSRFGCSRPAPRQTRRLCLATRRNWSIGATDLPANTRPELKDDTCGADQLPIRRVVLCFDRGRLDVQKRAVRKSTAQLARLLVNAGILDRAPD
jgi:Recombinase/Recombinase zinc beta ribbon domain